MLGRGGGGGLRALDWHPFRQSSNSLFLQEFHQPLITCYAAQNHFLSALNELFIVPYFC